MELCRCTTIGELFKLFRARSLANNNAQANRLTVFQQDEILQKIRKWYPKFLEKIKPEQIVETHFNYPGGTSHRSDLLAEGILSCSTESSLQKIAKSMRLVVGCPIN